MPKNWDTPYTYEKGNKEFPGDKSSPGDYSNNPSIPLPMTGDFNVKFFETMPSGTNIPMDSPIDYANFKEHEKAGTKPSSGASVPKPSKDFYDSPYKDVYPLKK